LVQNAHPPGSDRANGELLETGNTEFAHNENIERHAQAFCHFVGDWNPAPRETKHDYVSATSILDELLRK
jgi:hypothetical protein